MTATLPDSVTAALRTVAVPTTGRSVGYHVAVDSDAAAQIGNRIHLMFGKVRAALDEVTRTAAVAAEGLDVGQSSYEVQWVEQAAEKLAAAKLELTTLMEVAAYLLTQEQVVVAHSSAPVRFHVAK